MRTRESFTSILENYFNRMCAQFNLIPDLAVITIGSKHATFFIKRKLAYAPRDLSFQGISRIHILSPPWELLLSLTGAP